MVREMIRTAAYQVLRPLRRSKTVLIALVLVSLAIPAVADTISTETKKRKAAPGGGDSGVEVPPAEEELEPNRWRNLRWSLFGGRWSDLSNVADGVTPEFLSLEIGRSEADGEVVGATFTLPLNNRWDVDLSLFGGTGEANWPLTVEGRQDGAVTADLDLWGAELATRYTVPLTTKVLPWVEVGLRGVRISLENAAARLDVGHFEVEEPPATASVEGLVGLGVERRLGSRFSLGVETTYGTESRWRAGGYFAFDFRDRLFRRTRIDLDVDTDRDGCVDDVLDEPGEETFSPEAGAIVLANLDDDDGDGRADAANPIFDKRDAEDFAPVVVRRRGRPGFLEGPAFLQITRELAQWVRIFWQGRIVLGPSSGIAHGDYVRWKLPPVSHLELDLEALSYADSEFSGIVEITAIQRSLFGRDRVLDRVQLRVAPWIMIHHLQPTEAVFVGQPAGNEVMVDQLKKILTTHGLAAPRFAGSHKFPQDLQQMGYSLAPARPERSCGNDETEVMRAALQNPYRDSKVVEVAPDQSVVDTIRAGGDFSLNSFGNLEVTPPLDGWPLGRIYFGGSGNFGSEGEVTDEERRASSDLMQFLAAQQVQAPLELDSSWLYIGHVDEILSFIPYPAARTGEKPFKVLIASPRDALAALVFGYMLGQEIPRSCSTEGVEALVGYYPANIAWQAKIDAVRDKMKREFGLDEGDFIDVPVLYELKGAESRALAALPNMVNLLVASGHLIIPDPCAESFRTVIERRLREIGYQEGRAVNGYSFIDTAFLHDSAGEIHCGTNSIREIPDSPWWSIP